MKDPDQVQRPWSRQINSGVWEKGTTKYQTSRRVVVE